MTEDTNETMDSRRDAVLMDMLISMSGLYGYKAEKIDKLMLGDVEISSTEIRRRISSMDIEGAAGMMGDGYYLYFNADDADININRKNRYISIDVKAEDNKILPASGVYYSRVCIDGGLYNSLCVFADTLTQHTNDAPEKKAASRFVRIYILDTEIPVSGTFRVDIFGLRRKFKSIETDINSLFLSNDELQVAKEYYLDKYV